MFVEDVVLGGLKAGSFWFLRDSSLQGDARTGNPDDVARQIAGSNDLRGVPNRMIWGYRLSANRVTLPDDQLHELHAVPALTGT